MAFRIATTGRPTSDPRAVWVHRVSFGLFMATLLAARGAAPNDDFADRIALTGGRIDLDASTVGATVEPGEPVHGAVQGGHSLWWSWTPPATGMAQLGLIRCCFSQSAAIYTGTSLTTLQQVAAVQGSFGQASFMVQAGVEYQIALDQPSGPQQPIAAFLQLIVGPPNDHFANRTIVNGNQAALIADEFLATPEMDDPDLGVGLAGRTVWWSWTAPQDGQGVVRRTSSVPFAFGVFVGDTLKTLQPVVVRAEPALFSVRAGVAYQIVADTPPDYAGGALGLSLALIPPPAIVPGSLSYHPATGFSFQISDQPNRSVTVELSGDLQTWASYQTIVMGQGPVTVTLPPDGAVAGRFVRLNAVLPR